MGKEAYIVKDNSYLCHVEHNYTEQAIPPWLYGRHRQHGTEGGISKAFQTQLSTYSSFLK